MTIDLVDKKRNFVERQVTAAADLISVLDRWRALRREWDASAYAPGAANEITPGDMADTTNDHVAAQQLADAFGALEQVETALAAGWLTNLYKLVP